MAFNALCPRCKGQVVLIEATVSCAAPVPVRSDGWTLTAGRDETSRERFQCKDCRQDVPARYVRGEMSSKMACVVMAELDGVDARMQGRGPTPKARRGPKACAKEDA
jgi:hypothetical protein